MERDMHFYEYDITNMDTHACMRIMSTAVDMIALAWYDHISFARIRFANVTFTTHTANNEAMT